MAGTFEITVATNAPQVAALVRHLRRDQLPFAAAVALTRTAQGARDEQREAMPHRFHLRNKRVLRGITIERANKRDWPHTRAIVGTRDEFIAQHEKGGIKRAKGGGDVAIPSDVIRRRRTARGTIPKPLKPRELIGRGSAFIGLRGGERVVQLRRQRKRTMGGLLGAYLLRPKVRLRPTLGMEETVKGYARRHWPVNFEREFRAAVRTARRRARV